MSTRKAPPAGGTLRTQIGPFVIVPNWILDSCRDPRGVQLYCVLCRFANREGRAWPSREHLLEAMDTSGRNLDRAIAALKAIHALRVRTRHRKDGAVVGVDYLLLQAPPAPQILLAAEGQQAMPANGFAEAADSEMRHFATRGEKENLPIETLNVSSASDDLFAASGEKAADRLLLAADGEMEAEPFRQNRGSFSPHVANAYKEELDPDNQIQERERETAPPAPARAPVNTTDPCHAFLQIWNQHVIEPIAQVSALTPKRRRFITARLAERPLEQWGPIIARMARGSFCRGSKGWVASFHWFIKDADAAQNTLEGQYDDDAPMVRRSVPVDSWEISQAITRRREHHGDRCPHEPVHRGAAGSDEQLACLEALALEMRNERRDRISA